LRLTGGDSKPTSLQSTVKERWMISDLMDLKVSTKKFCILLATEFIVAAMVFLLAA
jgi:hypothetical protein